MVARLRVRGTALTNRVEYNTRSAVAMGFMDKNYPYKTREYKCQREGNIIVKPHLLPRIQGLGGI